MTHYTTVLVEKRGADDHRIAMGQERQAEPPRYIDIGERSCNSMIDAAHD